MDKLRFSKKIPVSINQYQLYASIVPGQYEGDFRYKLTHGRITKSGKFQTLNESYNGEYEIIDYDVQPDTIKRFDLWKDGELEALCQTPIKYNKHAGHVNCEVLEELSLFTGKELNDYIKRTGKAFVGNYGYKLDDFHNDRYYVGTITRYSYKYIKDWFPYTKLIIDEQNIPMINSYWIEYRIVNKLTDYDISVDFKTRYHDSWDRTGTPGLWDAIEAVKYEMNKINLPVNIDLHNDTQISEGEQEPIYEPYEGLIGYYAHGKAHCTITTDMIDYSEEALCKHFKCKRYEIQTS